MMNIKKRSEKQEEVEELIDVAFLGATINWRLTIPG